MPRKNKGKERELKYSDSDLQGALLDVNENGLFFYAAELKWGVPRRTLQSRQQGEHLSQDAQIQPAARLSRKHEKRVVQWILKQEPLGYAPSAAVVRSVVLSILEGMGDERPLGKGWITSFKKRNPEIATKIGRKQEAARFIAFTPKAVE